MTQTPPRIALITGAGSGVGRSAAIALAGDGMQVVLSGRRAAALAETAELIAQQHPEAPEPLSQVADVCSESSVSELFAQVRESFGRLDVLFNNAGINVPATPVEELELADWQAVVDTNLTGIFLCTREAVRLMSTQDPKGGRIINNGSISASVPRPNSLVYTATKHAVTGMTKSTALDGRKHNIACGQIDIGNALTEMAGKMTQGVPQADGTVRVEPVMDVKHVGEAVAHMASLPLSANVPFMTIMATKMPLLGRG